MAREFVQSSFFNTSVWANTYYAAQIPIEYYLADVLLRHDVSRVIWASDAYAFRRRYELSDMAAGEFGAIAPSSLNFPFVNYWYESGAWVPDDRPWAVSPTQILQGLWEQGFPNYLKAMAVKTTFTATAFFSRDDDARLAQELLMWEYQPKGPIYLATPLDWRGREILMPVYLTLEQPNFNPNFNETDWLKTQRIFPIKFTFTARTYILSYPRQQLLTNVDSTDVSPPFNRAYYNEEPDDPIVITEKAILEFATAKNWGTMDTTIEGDINPSTIDVYEGYFQPPVDFSIDTCTITDGSVTMTSAGIEWEYLSAGFASDPSIPAHIELFDNLKILVPGQEPIIIDDPNVTTQTISNLLPSSAYDITLLFYSTTGSVQTYKLSVTTAEDGSNAVTTPITKRKGSLKGMIW